MPALWTPYADAEILDLSKSASIKAEPLSPAPTPPPPPTPPQATPPVPYGYYIPATIEPTLPPIGYYSSQYSFQYGHHPQISPSTSSGFDDAYHHRTISATPPDSESEPSQFSYDSEYLNNNPEYIMFERDALRAMAEKNGGTLLGNNPRMRRSVRSTKEEVDDGYKQQRERNNVAAKQSRDRRKLREVKLALKVSFLEKQTRRLQAMLAAGLCSKCFPHHDLL